MAACDHTIICFHNGKLMRTLYREERNSFKSLVPFKYNRDALPGDIVFNEIKQVPVFWEQVSQMSPTQSGRLFL